MMIWFIYADGTEEEHHVPEGKLLPWWEVAKLKPLEPGPEVWEDGKLPDPGETTATRHIFKLFKCHQPDDKALRWPRYAYLEDGGTR
jgi:hypothetical protein